MSKWKIDSKGRECTRCDTYKSWNAFYKASSGARGRSSTCMACRHDINLANNPKKGVIEGFDALRQAFINGRYKRDESFQE